MTPFEFFLAALCIVLILGWGRAAKGWEKAEAEITANQKQLDDYLAIKKRSEAELEAREWPEIIEQ